MEHRSNHIRNKSCVSAFKTISADEIEQQVLNEIFKILSSPEVVININRIIEADAGKTASPEILKENIVSALNNQPYRSLVLSLPFRAAKGLENAARRGYVS